MGRCCYASRDWTWRVIGILASLTVVAMQVGARVIALSVAARMRSGSGCREDAISICRVTLKSVGKEVGALVVVYIFLGLLTFALATRRGRKRLWYYFAMVVRIVFVMFCYVGCLQCCHGLVP